MTYHRSRHVALLDTKTLLCKQCCGLTDTDYVYHTTVTQRDVTYKVLLHSACQEFARIYEKLVIIKSESDFIHTRPISLYYVYILYYI